MRHFKYLIGFLLISSWACSQNIKRKTRGTLDQHKMWIKKAFPSDSIEFKQANISRFSYTCEQGLFFILSKNRIIGGINFVPNTGSCLFVFKGEKKDSIYKIICADYGNAELKKGELRYSINGIMTIDTLNGVVKIKLDKDPDACMKAFGVSLTSETAFDVENKLIDKWEYLGIVKNDLNMKGTNTKKKIKIGQFEIIKIISELSTKFMISYHDSGTDNDFIGEVDKSSILLVK